MAGTRPEVVSVVSGLYSSSQNPMKSTRPKAIRMLFPDAGEVLC